MLPEHVPANNGVYKSLFHATVFLISDGYQRAQLKVLSVFLAMSLSRKHTHVISSRLWRQLLQELHVELDSADKRCIFLSSQQLGVHVLIGFQHLLILIAVIKQEVVQA